MPVVFAVECRKTRPGEKVFVVGGHGSLGSWDVSLALPIETTAATFPVWQSQPIPLPEGSKVEFKFVVMRETRTGQVLWEEIGAGNREVTSQEGAQVTARCVWGSPKCNVDVKVMATAPVQSKRQVTKQQQLAKEQAEEQMMINMAENCVDEAAAEVLEAQPEMAADLEARDAMRRNFSQSIFDSLLVTGDSEEGALARQMSNKSASEGFAGYGGDCVVIQTPCDGEEDEEDPQGAPLAPMMPERGVPLKNIASFSALSQIMPGIEKTEKRAKGRKAQSHYDPFNLEIPVVIVTSEVAPWSKTGGLGLVASSYSYEFARNGHRTMCISPKYEHYDKIAFAGETTVIVNGKEEVVKFWHRYMDHGNGKGCDMLFVDHPCIERGGGLYNGDDGREYADNVFRFTLLSLAALEAPLIMEFDGQAPYGDKCLFLANDWQAGLVPAYMCHKYRCNGTYTESRVIYVIHNLGYQGQYHGYDACKFFGLEKQGAGDISLGNCINLCKGALICADRVITVSPNYAEEIKTASGGFNLQDFVCAKAHAHRLTGILNGIDDCWNPETDKDINVNFSVQDFEEGKRQNKKLLQRQLNLTEDPDVVLIGFVGRLTWQKGVDVLGSIISWLMEDTGNGVTGRIQLIMMGNGDSKNADVLKSAEHNYPRRVCGYVGFDPKVEHQLMAGADCFLMPSRYEPCGLPQMYSQQYGCLPIVTATGGLKDSVKDVSEGSKSTGFLIPHLAADKMKETIYKAAELYLKRPVEFRRMQRTAMTTDFYWPQAMDDYEKQIDEALFEAPTVR